MALESFGEELLDLLTDATAQNFDQFIAATVNTASASQQQEYRKFLKDINDITFIAKLFKSREFGVSQEDARVKMSVEVNGESKSAFGRFNTIIATGITKEDVPDLAFLVGLPDAIA